MSMLEMNIKPIAIVVPEDPEVPEEVDGFGFFVKINARIVATTIEVAIAPNTSTFIT